MAYESWNDFLAFLKRQVPQVFRTGRFNFITIHYFYITGFTIFTSVVVYGIGGMQYIDSLFFASGASVSSRSCSASEY
jgi:hypothetical protein